MSGIKNQVLNTSNREEASKMQSLFIPVLLPEVVKFHLVTVWFYMRSHQENVVDLSCITGYVLMFVSRWKWQRGISLVSLSLRLCELVTDQSFFLSGLSQIEKKIGYGLLHADRYLRNEEFLISILYGPGQSCPAANQIANCKIIKLTPKTGRLVSSVKNIELNIREGF